MTKELWEKIRTQEEIPMWVFFDCYREQGGLITNIKKFENILAQLISQSAVFIKGETPVQITYESVVKKTYNYFDKKFGIIWYNA